ncbi:hypothetical protein Ciccas_002151 [Cichlidogyrus casuarinus]|uniref:Uncharacterized protein n=1 Tax=Cichlidogyrus casuarinus TaxID=1844966 RepID=A0ABD2QI18_9PLAT
MGIFGENKENSISPLLAVNDQPLCQAQSDSNLAIEDIADKYNETVEKWTSLFFFFLANFLTGVSYTPFWMVGYVLLDQLSGENSAVHIGALFILVSVPFFLIDAVPPSEAPQLTRRQSRKTSIKSPNIELSTAGDAKERRSVTPPSKRGSLVMHNPNRRYSRLTNEVESMMLLPTFPTETRGSIVGAIPSYALQHLSELRNSAFEMMINHLKVLDYDTLVNAKAY